MRMAHISERLVPSWRAVRVRRRGLVGGGVSLECVTGVCHRNVKAAQRKPHLPIVTFY